MQTALTLAKPIVADNASPAVDTPALLAATTALVDAFTRSMESVAGNCDESGSTKLVASMAAILAAVARQIDHA